MAGIFGSIASALEQKAVGTTTIGQIETIWAELFGGRAANSGATVNWQTALQCTTVLACARRISETLMVPCKIYQRDPKTGVRREAREHPVYELLEYAPNQWQSGLEYRETIGLHAALTFNHYSYINRVGGRIKELIPLDPSTVTVTQNTLGENSYRVKLYGNNLSTFSRDEIWHIPGPSWSGSVGLDAIRLMKEAIGLALATEETHARLHSNGAQPGGILTTDKTLDSAARDRLKAQWSSNHVGMAQKFKTAVLDNGLKWQPTSMSGVDAQHIQVRQMQIEQICSAMCVMTIMIGHTGDKAPTYASAEQMFKAHLAYTARPWHSRVANSINRWLLTPEEFAAGYYAAFTEEAFDIASLKDKAEFYKIASGGGGNPAWLMPDEIRAFFEMASAVGGDRLYVPANLLPIGDDGFPRLPAVAAAKPPEV